ncbi:MAG: mechanosensitive ion channel domain-containing protein [Pyramidobacter sp.]|jgi:potassium efflux system protein
MKKHLLAAALILGLAGPVCAFDAVSIVTDGLKAGLEKTLPADDTTPQPFAPSSSDIEVNSKRLDEIDARLALWNNLPPEEAAARFGVTAEAVTQRVDVLASLKNAYARIEIAATRKKQDDAELEKRKSSAVAPELQLNEKPPFKLEYYEKFNEGIEALSKELDAAHDNLDLSTAYASKSQMQLNSDEAAWRLARDNVQREASKENQWNLQSAALTVEADRTQLILDQFSKERAAAAAELYRHQLDQRSKLYEYIWNNLSLDEEAFNAQTAALNEKIKALEAKQNSLSRQMRQADNALVAAEEKFRAVGGGAEKDAAQAELNYRSADRDRCRLALEHLQETLVLMATRRRMWGLIQDIHTDNLDKSGVPETLKKISADIAAIQAKVAGEQKSLLSFQTRLSEVERQLGDEAVGKSLAVTLQRHRAAAQGAIQDSLDFITTLSSVETLEKQVALMLEQTYKTVGIAQKTADSWKKKLASTLNTELWESSGYAVRLKEFLIALAIILFGTWGARRLVYMLSWAVAKYFHFDETSRRTFQRFIYYTAAIAIFLTALHIVGIPLTAFAFLGGAVAIAIGFGAQNIFKNIIGGILLTVNHPFRIGDVIEVGSLCGTVADVGVRSTLIRTFDEKEVVVPNSQLLDNQLINWSLSDALLRLTIDFGTAYGTPAKKVRETVLKIVDANPRILKTPEPWVYFADFGDSNLEFTLYFWINQKLASSLRVSSELREAIQEKFRQEGIAMAYPHMDVTLIDQDAPARLLGPEGPTQNKLP